MRHPRGFGVVAVLALCALSRVSWAQAAPPHDDGFDVQLFQLAVGPKTFFTVDNGDTADKGELSLDAMVTFLRNPFTIYNSSGPTNTMIVNERVPVVSNVTAAELTGAYGITDKLQVGAELPVVFALTGNSIDPNMGTANGNLQVTGLGDLLVEAKLRVYQENALHAAVIGGLTLPTMYISNGAAYTGDKLPTLQVRAAASWSTGRLALGGTAGLLLRDPQQFYGTTIGQQALWGAGAAFAIQPRFSVVGEAYGRVGLQDFSLNNSPIEAVGGLRVGVARSYSVMVGAGGGLDQAIGSPLFRIFASLSYVPGAYGSAPELAPPDTETDHDHDGIPDKEDKCPNQAEDHDGFQDEDGCPDLDNDKDGIPDLQDRCPDDAEDGKPPYPKDGCPATKRDSDGDGIVDANDQCPLQEEDMDGFEDADGCPDPDNDGDGIPDAQDKCPLCPEDKDGFEDADGCPDLDNDKDGIPDAQDKCPNEPETINGYKDDDGCPDTGGTQLVKLDGDRLTIDRVPSLSGRSLSASGIAVAHQIGLVMRGHSEVTKWLIAISQRDASDAQRIGDALKAYLATMGVKNVDVLGAAGPPKIGAIVQERGDASATMCPAELQVKPRPAGAVPAKAAQPAAPAAPAAKAAKPAPAAKATPPTPAKDQPKQDQPKQDDGPEIDMGN